MKKKYGLIRRAWADAAFNVYVDEAHRYEYASEGIDYTEVGRPDVPQVLRRCVAFLDELRGLARRFFGSLQCRMEGHDWEDESVAGPDSGNIAMHCRRCDESFTHWLY